jgi:hypothetical protein
MRGMEGMEGMGEGVWGLRNRAEGYILTKKGDGGACIAWRFG